MRVCTDGISHFSEFDADTTRMSRALSPGRKGSRVCRLRCAASCGHPPASLKVQFLKVQFHLVTDQPDLLHRQQAQYPVEPGQIHRPASFRAKCLELAFVRQHKAPGVAT